tara:strand:+ start:246 stop:635 length:390 start_codon:yes stop_codon:yes gene_type:complete
MADIAQVGLMGKKSLYDRHEREVLGNAVGTADVTAGQYYTSETGLINSPFINGSGDHMLDLMTTTVQSGNSGITYLPSPSLGAPPAHYQDLDTPMIDNFSGQPAVPSLGQFGGPYLSQGPCTSGGGFCS